MQPCWAAHASCPLAELHKGTVPVPRDQPSLVGISGVSSPRPPWPEDHYMGEFRPVLTSVHLTAEQGPRDRLPSARTRHPRCPWQWSEQPAPMQHAPRSWTKWVDKVFEASRLMSWAGPRVREDWKPCPQPSPTPLPLPGLWTTPSLLLPRSAEFGPVPGAPSCLTSALALPGGLTWHPCAPAGAPAGCMESLCSSR